MTYQTNLYDFNFLGFSYFGGCINSSDDAFDDFFIVLLFIFFADIVEDYLEGNIKDEKFALQILLFP